MRLLDISNLSTGGMAVDHTDIVADRWRRLAVGIAPEFGGHQFVVDTQVATARGCGTIRAWSPFHIS